MSGILIQEHCSNYACSMHSCQTFGQIPASSPFSVTRFRIKGKLWTELVTEASSGGPQSIPATNPPCPNSRSSSPLSPPYIPRAPTTPHFFLSDHQGRWYLPSASPSSAWHSLLVSTKRFAATIGTQHLTATTAISRLDNDSTEHGPVGLTVTRLPGTYLKLPLRLPPPTGDRPREMFGPAKSDWYLHNQLVISWQPSVRQHNSKVDDWMSTRVSGCQVCAYGHPPYTWTRCLYGQHVICWSPSWTCFSTLTPPPHTPNTAGESLLKLPS